MSTRRRPRHQPAAPALAQLLAHPRPARPSIARVPRPRGAHRLQPSVGRPLVVLLAVACAVTVANLYYAQPLLDAIARQLGVGSGAAGLIVTLSQLGYAAGLLFLVPLGDLRDRRQLVALLLLVGAAALALVASAPSFPLLGAAIIAVGLTSVVAQILVPFAATLASDRDRGQVVGHVMTGLLLGTLLSRTTAGVVAQVAGWRAMYVLAAGITTALALLLYRLLPHAPATAPAGYPRLLRSVWQLMAREPVLRLRAVYGALSFATFNVLWTPMAFQLAGAPFRFGEAAIGVFSLLMVPLAFSTGLVGRLADLGRARVLTGGSFAIMLAGAGLALAGGSHLVGLGVSAMLITLGAQSTHLTNQSTIYRLDPAARSRLTTAYMTCFFGGGVAGSALAAGAYARFGWPGVCGLLGTMSLAGLLVWWREPGRPARRGIIATPRRKQWEVSTCGSPTPE